ncbi:MAG: transglycosylase SLT domain-containing protein [Chloroflexi bacterium]|nr:transglycosylase SLT domain-containing protein [Chloroflexota bacterium]
MAVQTKPYAHKAVKKSPQKPKTKPQSRAGWLRYLPGWIIIAFVLAILLPNALASTFGVVNRVMSAVPHVTGIETVYVAPAGVGANVIAPMFTKEVRHWSSDIQRWAQQYGLDPNLLATVMQIESCGYDTVSSHAGAQGLFQVMPFHFSAGEDMLDPDTNAMRGANFLNECLGYANGDTGLAMACYNGGPSVISRAFDSWANETQRYYIYGTGIYADAQQGLSSSEMLNTWYTSGGVNLCNRASVALGLE